MQFKTDTPMPDVFNRRIRKSVSQNTRTRVTRYGWDGERMCAEVKDGLTRTTIYEPGSHVPLLRIDQEEQSPEPVPNLALAPGVQRLFAPPSPKLPVRIAHYHTDHLGTPLMLTGQEGKVLWRASPDDWSAVRDEKGETDQPIRFQGQQLDEESGLHYNFNRYYDPSIGRYVTQDPIGLAGGVNTYSYAIGNSIKHKDPLGLYVPDLPWTPEDTKQRNCFIRKYRKDNFIGAWGASRADRKAHPEDLNRRNAEHYLYAEQLRQEGGTAWALAGVAVHEANKIVRLPDSVPWSTTPPTKGGEIAGYEGATGATIPDGPDENCECIK